MSVSGFAVYVDFSVAIFNLLLSIVSVRKLVRGLSPWQDWFGIVNRDIDDTAI